MAILLEYLWMRDLVMIMIMTRTFSDEMEDTVDNEPEPESE